MWKFTWYFDITRVEREGVGKVLWIIRQIDIKGEVPHRPFWEEEHKGGIGTAALCLSTRMAENTPHFQRETKASKRSKMK